jgi:Methyltransferase domain
LTGGSTAVTLAGVTGTPDHVRRNHVAWDRWAAEYAGPGRENWAALRPSWGIWSVPEAQPATAATLQDQFGLRFPLVHASAEQIPFADASFDLVISEYGAHVVLSWPEEDDLPADRTLRRPYFGLQICDLIEIRPPPGSTSRQPIATLEWARQWPCEEVWKAGKPL